MLLVADGSCEWVLTLMAGFYLQKGPELSYLPFPALRGKQQTKKHDIPVHGQHGCILTCAPDIHEGCSLGISVAISTMPGRESR